MWQDYIFLCTFLEKTCHLWYFSFIHDSIGFTWPCSRGDKQIDDEYRWIKVERAREVEEEEEEDEEDEDEKDEKEEVEEDKEEV